MKKVLYLVVLASLVLTACGAPVATEAPTKQVVPSEVMEPTAAEAATEDPASEAASELAIVAATESYEAPALVKSGWVTVSLSNQGQARRQAAIFKFEEGKTMADLAAALQSGTPGIPQFLTALGGPAGVVPGASGSVVIELQPGSYVIMDPAPDETGVPAVASGFLQPFEVAAEDNDNAEPQADLTISMIDYSFVIDAAEVAAGSVTIKLVNDGPMEAHEVAIVKLNEGASVQDFLAATAPDAPPGPPPGQGVAGMAALEVDEHGYVTIDLEDGATYGLICFLPSSHNQGAPHFTLGMVSQFTVGTN